VEIENTDGSEPDLVVDVSPSGTIAEGDAVTVTYVGKPEGGPGGPGPGGDGPPGQDEEGGDEG